MADPVTAGHDKTMRCILGFAMDLEAKLPAARDAASVELLVVDLGYHLKAIQDLARPGSRLAAPGKGKELERQGRTLWNACIRASRDTCGVAAPPRVRAQLLVSALVFAFHMLELGRRAGRGGRLAEADIVYLLNLAVTLARVCFADDELYYARLALRQAADYVEQLRPFADADTNSGLPGPGQRLEVEYLTMRVALLWKEDRLDVAEHMFGKTSALRHNLHPSSTETMANTLHHIGAELASKGNHTLALHWFKRAHDLINAPALEKLSVCGLELRLAIYHGHVQSLLVVGSPESLQEASDLVAYVESELGDKLVVLHWRLELLQKFPTEVADAEAYTCILRRMVRCFDHSDDTFYFLMHHIKAVADKAARLACGLLDELLKQHVLRSANVAWIDKAVVRRAWVATVLPDCDSVFTTLQGVLDSTLDSLSGPLSPDATGALHSLVWKKVEALLASQQYAVADAWCELALHQLLASGGEANLGKFGRKRILCALKLNDAEKAKHVFHNMPKGAQNDVLTRYLIFKVSLLSWDHELGRESIAHLGNFSRTNRGQEILYACVREAQNFGDKLCTLAALRAVADSWVPGQATSSSLPAVLRCTIRLINMAENEQDAKRDCLSEQIDFAQDMCHMFVQAAGYARQHPKDEDGKVIFTVAELHWFRKNAYNMGATKCHTWPLALVTGMLSACLAFIDCYPKDFPRAEEAELRLMSMRCHFFMAAALISLARAEDSMDEQLQRYLEARRHVAAFDDLMQAGVSSEDEAIAKDTAGKMAMLLVFDLESAVSLRGWDDLSQIIRKAKPCRDETTYKAMGDCLLRSGAPGKVLYATMRLIINEIFELDDFDSSKLAKYLRCMVQAVLPLDDGLALQLMDQALQIAREGRQVGRSFPDAELEWLVTTAFNHAVDFYARAEEGACHRWALKAMELAGYADDGGSLVALLQDVSQAGTAI